MLSEQQIPVLDLGYVKYIEHWGSDTKIIESARMSTHKGFLGWDRDTYWVCPTCQYTLVNDVPPPSPKTAFSPSGNTSTTLECEFNCPNGHGRLAVDGRSHPGDARLLSYLYKHHHDTPFEMAGLVIEVQAPIMVFREWHRHRTQSYNELSARYTPLPDMNYVPSPERCLMVSGANKQAGAASDHELTHDDVLNWLDLLAGAYRHAQQVYEVGLKIGIPKELARLPVPVGRYSRMRAQANLRNWLAFLTLRSDKVPSGKYAQFEIRQYANAVADLIAELFPRTYALFVGDK